MKKAIAIGAWTAVCGLGAGLAISVATFARADDEHQAPSVIPARAEAASVAPRAATSEVPSATPRTVAPSPATDGRAPQREPLRVRRVLAARGVEGHEPVEPFEVLGSSDELDRVFGFVELENRGDERAEVVVTFEHESGFATGHVALEVPPRTPRWRTWAFTRHVDRPGQWAVVVRDRDGRRLAQGEFEVRR